MFDLFIERKGDKIIKKIFSTGFTPTKGKFIKSFNTYKEALRYNGF